MKKVCMLLDVPCFVMRVVELSARVVRVLLVLVFDMLFCCCGTLQVVEVFVGFVLVWRLQEFCCFCVGIVWRQEGSCWCFGGVCCKFMVVCKFRRFLYLQIRKLKIWNLKH